MRIGRVLRIGGAIALLVAGLVHLDLYFGGYRSAGTEPDFGRSILLNAIVSGIVAALVAVRREWFFRVAGIVLAVATLAAFTYTHSGNTFLGFEGDGLEPSPQALIVLVAEIAAIVLLAATFVPSIAARDESSGVPVLAVTGIVAAAAFIGFGVYWADKYGTTTTAAEPSAVSIVDFAFAPPELTVPQGSTVTWTNNDPFAHSVVAGDGAFASPALDSGATFEFTFDTAGEYAYVCGIHPEMSGTVTVTD